MVEDVGEGYNTSVKFFFGLLDIKKKRQHRFPNKRSWLPQLLENYQNIIKELEEAKCNGWCFISRDSKKLGVMVDVLWMECPKAPDTINHRVLFYKPRSISVEDYLLVWVHSFLEQKTGCSCLLCGVSQGTVLGPLIIIPVAHKWYRRRHKYFLCIILWRRHWAYLESKEWGGEILRRP